MNRTLFLKSLAYFIVAVTLLSCQDHLTTPTGPQRFRLKQIVNSTAQSGTVTTTLTYNSAGKLSNYTENYSFTGGIAQYYLQYDSQGRLVNRERRDEKGVLQYRATFDSDANGNITSVKLYLSPDHPAQYLYRSLDIEYGAGKLPAKSTFTEFGEIKSVILYTYNNGNITRTDSQALPSGIPASSTTFTYDDKPNPYRGLIGLDRPLVELTNRNNEIRSLYTYDYDSNGLLTRVGANRLSAYESYEYEPY